MNVEIVTMTSQGQLTIPKEFRIAFGLRGSTKMAIRKKGGVMIVEPRSDFWDLKGSLRSSAKQSDRALRAARNAFEKKWARKI
ncbi:AbrB/MazE/SpoVT family DNA-binding domain-containing protein [Candidatus Uhrbacteria bacterium]|nr:AbrB/MazE/SpoVT family DNA-binding domain-containing protein [Candidatus Uhrbacteria bacterium]